MSPSFFEGDFPAQDGTRLSYFFTPFSGEKKPLLLILHGFGEHSRRYLSLVEALRDLPFGFAAFDLRGHGRSGGERVYAESFSAYTKDVGAFLDFLSSRHPGNTDEVLLFGHSMGAEIAAFFALLNPGRIRELIFSAPCFALRQEIPFVTEVCRLLGGRFPHFILRNPVKPVFLSHDFSEVLEYEKDPLIERRITLGLLREMISVGETILERAGEISMPVHVLAAGCERIVSKAAARRFYERIASVRKQWVEFDGFYHDLFRETDREQCVRVLRDILAGVVGIG